MIVYFGLDGRLKETVSSYTLRDSGGNEHVSFGRRKGSAGANEILAIFEGGAPTKGALAITYRLPSGEFYEPADLVVDNAFTGYIEFDRTKDLKYLEYEKKYEVVEFDFPKGLFPNGGDGLYLATIRNIQGETLIRAYGLITFSVEDSAVKRDSYITESQYDYLVSLIESSPLYVRKAGDTMTGPLNVPAGTTEMGGATEKEITNKQYVDEGLDRKFDKTGGTIGGLVSVNGNMTVSGDVTSSGGSFASPQIVWNSPDKIPNAKDVTEYFVNKKRNNFSAAKETVETLVDFQTAPKSQQEPVAADDLATKGYVDGSIASGGGYNVENGSGDGSIQQKGSQAVGSHSAAFGLGAYAGSEGEVAVGRYNEKGDAAFAVGAGSSDSDRKNAIHVARTGAVTVGRTDKGAGVNFFADNFFFEASGQAVFNVKQATFAGNVTAYSITATTFKSVTAENLSTKQYTIGLAKGNAEAIQSYIGLYAEKYDGENYGALVWDSTGTAYVGDASVDENGVVSDPNNQLQPILTRTASAEMDATPFGVIAWNPFIKAAYNTGILSQTLASTQKANLWSGRQSFNDGFGLPTVGEDNKEILWFSKDLNNKLLMKANGQSVQFQDAKGGVVAYLSDLDDKASKTEFENLVKVTATDVGKDANGFAVLCHDGVEITGQRKSVRLADVRENGAVIGRDQTTSAPQTNELITKAYADKEYKFKYYEDELSFWNDWNSKEHTVGEEVAVAWKGTSFQDLRFAIGTISRISDNKTKVYLIGYGERGISTSSITYDHYAYARPTLTFSYKTISPKEVSISGTVLMDSSSNQYYGIFSPIAPSLVNFGGVASGFRRVDDSTNRYCVGTFKAGAMYQGNAQALTLIFDYDNKEVYYPTGGEVYYDASGWQNAIKGSDLKKAIDSIAEAGTSVTIRRW